MYDLILTDNPWEYDNKQTNDPARGGIIYPTLTMNELAELPIYKIANNNSILVYWVTLPKLVDNYYKDAKNHTPLSIIQAWGFRPVTVLFVWVKLNRNAGKDLPLDDEDWPYYHKDDFYSGLGRYTNSNVEVAIVARRGKGLPRVNKNVKQLIFAPINKHSEKPREQYDKLYSLYGDVKRVELFARKQNPPPVGWDATGLDYDGMDIRDWIKGYINENTSQTT